MKHRLLSGVVIATVSSVGLASPAIAQAQEYRFDAVSLRRVEPSGSGRGSTTNHIESGRVQLHRYPLQALVTMAYKMSSFQVVWPKKDREAYYDVEAVMPKDTTEERRDLMLQNMLRDRLGFRAHREVRPLSAFVLTVSAKGLKLEKADGPSDPEDIHLGRLWNTPSDHSVKGNITMGQLTEMFRPFLYGPFLDRTGLQGYYAIELSVPREQQIPADIDTDHLTVETAKELGGWDNAVFNNALEKQAGLHVDSRVVDTEMVVVDTFNPDPTEN